MMQDIRVLTWLRWKQWLDVAVYWLRVLGYQPPEKGENAWVGNLYILYLLGIGVLWFGTMWSWVYESAQSLSLLMSTDIRANFEMIIALVWFVTGIAAIITALNSSPLKLSFQDMAYIVASNVNPTAIVILSFIRQLLVRMLIFGSLFAVISIVLTRSLSSALPPTAPFRALLIVIPLVVIIWGIAWLVGLTRLTIIQKQYRKYLWLIPISLTVTGILIPNIAFWLGRIVQNYIVQELPLTWVLLLIVPIALLVTLIINMSSKIDLAQVADESILYARIQALGMMAWRQIDVQIRIRMQAVQQPRPSRLHLPNAVGFPVIVARAALSYLRHPLMLILALIWGAVTTQLVIWIIANNFPVQVWIGLLLLISIAPPVGLVYAFEKDVAERFLRQFIPFDGMQLLIADSLLPWILVSLGGAIICLVQPIPLDVKLIAVVMVIVLAALLIIIGAFSITSQRVLQSRMIATGLSYGTIIVVGIGFQSILFAAVAAMLAIMILTALISANA
jgi:hypothetical protein